MANANQHFRTALIAVADAQVHMVQASAAVEQSLRHLAAQDGFADINQTLQIMAAQLNRVEDKLDRLDLKLDRLDLKLDRLDLKIDVIEERSVARTRNSTANDDSELVPLTVLPPLNGGAEVHPGAVPQGFPATLGDARVLTGQQVDPLLRAYGLPTDGLIGERRKRFLLFIGCH